jgi:hypothetical protein
MKMTVKFSVPHILGSSPAETLIATSPPNAI